VSCSVEPEDWEARRLKMFWKKKQMVAPATAVKPPETKAGKPLPEPEKPPGPQDIPELVGRHLVVQKKKDPDWVWRLKAVVRKSPKGRKAFDVRVFDAAAVSKKVKVKDYTSLDEHPDLILFEGWFDKESMTAELEEKKREKKVGLEVSEEVIIFTEAEIWQKIVGLRKPGSTVFFYLAGSPSSGGPLGRGAAVVELNPNYPGKGQKRYIVYTDDVEGMKPTNKRRRMFDSDRSKEIARWIKERHYKSSMP